ncbi:MAG: hypothetical protein RLN87_01620, partial [Parasphingopyxis sp.]
MRNDSGRVSSRQQRRLWLLAGSAIVSAASYGGPAAAQMHGDARPPMMAENEPHMRSPGMRGENRPHVRAPEMRAVNIPHQNVGRPVLSGASQPQLPPVTMVIENQPQLVPTAPTGTHQPQATTIVGNQPQAFTPIPNGVQADVTLVSGTVNDPNVRVTTSIPGTGGLRDTITVSSDTVILNWSPVDTDVGGGSIDFLPADNALTFQRDNADFTVLNRIIPTDLNRPVQFNGLVESFTDTNVVGGTLWFYSPGGIVIGSGAQFDIGSLLLTSTDIDTSGGLLGGGSQIRLIGTAGGGSVVVENGATINANTNAASYVAMVAPLVNQGGTVQVDGSAAYVGAQQATLTIDNGLFDIAVTAGTTDANGVIHTGTTAGPSSAPTFSGVTGNVTNADAQAIYMVAVPQNDAITMLVSGNVGYQAAASANIVNGTVILSAGADVSSTVPTTGTSATPSFTLDRAGAAGSASIALGPTIFTSDTNAFASDTITLTTGAVTDFIVVGSGIGAQSLSLDAFNRIDINASGGGIIGASGDVNLRAGNGATGGTINITADQNGFTDDIISGLLVTGNLNVDVGAAGADDFFTVRNNGNTGIGEDAVGGSINVNVTGRGDIVVLGNAQFLAGAQGGKGEIQNGSGQGGDVTLSIDSGTFNVSGSTTIDTSVLSAQSGKIGGNGPGKIGSDSIAGDVTLNLSGGTFSSSGMTINARAEASSGDNNATVQSNDAAGGNIAFNVTGAAGSSGHSPGSLGIDASATAANSIDADGDEEVGIATFGSLSFDVSGGALNTNSIFATLAARGAAPALTDPVFSVAIGSGAAMDVDGTLDIVVSTTNGRVDTVSHGGDVSILADGGDFTFSDMFLDTGASAGGSFANSGEGQDFVGGDVSLIAQNGGSIASDPNGFHFLTTAALGNGATAGDGTGGNILFNAIDGTISFDGFLFIDASGQGGVRGSGAGTDDIGIGRGGMVTFRVEGDSGVMNLGDVFLDADGSIFFDVEGGVIDFSGIGGNGFGGSIVF